MIKKFMFGIVILCVAHSAYADEIEIVDEFLDNATYNIQVARDRALDGLVGLEFIAKEKELRAAKIELIKTEIRQALIDGCLGMQRVDDDLKPIKISDDTTDFLVDNIIELLKKINWLKVLALGDAFDLSYFLDHKFDQPKLEHIYIPPKHIDVLEHNIEHLNQNLKINIFLFGSTELPKLPPKLRALDVEIIL